MKGRDGEGHIVLLRARHAPGDILIAYSLPLLLGFVEVQVEISCL